MHRQNTCFCCCCLSHFLDRNIYIKSMKPCSLDFCKNILRTGQQLVLLTANAGQNMFRNSVSFIAFSAGRKDFNFKHVAMNTKVSTTEPSKGHLNASAITLNESCDRSVTSIPLMNGGYFPQSIDIFFGTRNNFRESKNITAVSIF